MRGWIRVRTVEGGATREVIRRLNSVFEGVEFTGLRDAVEEAGPLEELRGGEFDWLVDLLEELVDPEVEIAFTAPGAMAEGQTFRGRAEWVNLWRAWLSAWDEYRIETVGYEERGEVVIVDVVHHGRGRGSGLEIEIPQTQVWRIERGRVVSCHIYHVNSTCDR